MFISNTRELWPNFISYHWLHGGAPGDKSPCQYTPAPRTANKSEGKNLGTLEITKTGRGHAARNVLFSSLTFLNSTKEKWQGFCMKSEMVIWKIIGEILKSLRTLWCNYIWEFCVFGSFCFRLKKEWLQSLVCSAGISRNIWGYTRPARRRP